MGRDHIAGLHGVRDMREGIRLLGSMQECLRLILSRPQDADDIVDLDSANRSSIQQSQHIGLTYII